MLAVLGSASCRVSSSGLLKLKASVPWQVASHDHQHRRLQQTQHLQSLHSLALPSPAGQPRVEAISVGGGSRQSALTQPPGPGRSSSSAWSAMSAWSRLGLRVAVLLA